MWTVTVLLNLRLDHTAHRYLHAPQPSPAHAGRSKTRPPRATNASRLQKPVAPNSRRARQTAGATLTPRRPTTRPTSRPRTRCTSGVTNTCGQRANAGARVGQRIHGATGPQIAPRGPRGVSRPVKGKTRASQPLRQIREPSWATMAPSRGRWLWCASHPPTRPPRCAHRNCARRRRLTRDASRAPPRRLVAVICIGVNQASSQLRRRFVGTSDANRPLLLSEAGCARRAWRRSSWAAPP